jgi:hypothetical protein
MIKTQRITSTSTDPKHVEGYQEINVLKWFDNEWKILCPYYLRTDGRENNFNEGNVIFENFYQGSKVYDKVYPIKVYTSKYTQGNPKYLLWSYGTIDDKFDTLVNNKKELDEKLYLRWRNDLWKCQNAIRYPNGMNRRKFTQYTLCIDSKGNKSKIDYLTGRRELYMKQYIRLIRKTNEYKILLEMLQKGINLVICEIDVPCNNKKGNYGKDCDENNNCDMNIDKLNVLLNDPSEAFGHGLCLVYALLEDK